MLYTYTFRTAGLLTLLLTMVMFSCRNDFEYSDNSGQLHFSADTLFLDTIFSDISSSTYSFKVYNRQNEAINIPSVSLEKQENSRFRINVNGKTGPTVSDIIIEANDSIFVFVEVTAESTSQNSGEFLYEDRVRFYGTENDQFVQLITLVRDAHLLFPERSNGIKESVVLGMDESGEELRIEGFELDSDELIMNDEKPYVIYGYATVKPEDTLRILAGSRLYFHRESGILIQPGGTLLVSGSLSNDPELLENEVIFEGDRPEPEFSDIPGQWGTIWLRGGSGSHQIENLTIKNATVGLIIEEPGSQSVSTIKNTRILNSSSIGLLARGAHLTAQNLVVGNAGLYAMYIDRGGDYTLLHNTLANYWDRSFRSTPALYVSDNDLMGNSSQLSLFVANSIIYGRNAVEYQLEFTDIDTSELLFQNSLLRFESSDEDLNSLPYYDTTNTDFYLNCLFNADPLFTDPQKAQFSLQAESPARGTADAQISLQVPLDIRGVNRVTEPEMGAYEISEN
ncbi:hypothetical protein [Robertkochia aurantiaca]|uniref:hypothetical protein n=1 Tax=Robertkochia aurantiaca TaxID=2873700 RepID=UPI001CCEFA7A|nr:hypothetical protein [Robertkochia sp. 3YJGBD-33]